MVYKLEDRILFDAALPVDCASVAEYQELEAVHIISHGSAGRLILGNSEITMENLNQYAEEFNAWNSSLAPDADIILYGCDIASNDGAVLAEAIASAFDRSLLKLSNVATIGV